MLQHRFICHRHIVRVHSHTRCVLFYPIESRFAYGFLDFPTASELSCANQILVITACQARRQLNWNGGAWIASMNYCQNCCQIKLCLQHLQNKFGKLLGGHCPPLPPSVYGPAACTFAPKMGLIKSSRREFPKKLKRTSSRSRIQLSPCGPKAMGSF